MIRKFEVVAVSTVLFAKIWWKAKKEYGRVNGLQKSTYSNCIKYLNYVMGFGQQEK